MSRQLATAEMWHSRLFMSYDDALAEVDQLRQRLSLLERMAVDPSATPESLRRQDLIAAAEKAGFLNPELAARILAADDGDPAELVARLGSDFPYMRKPDMNELLRSPRPSAPTRARGAAQGAGR